MGKNVGFASALLLSALVAAGCSGEPEISNTGYVGMWKRGSDELQSTISIVRNGDGYLFRWNLASADNRRKVDCDWSGYCKEFSDGELTAEHWFEAVVNPDNDRIVLTGRARFRGENQREDRFVEELRVRKEGAQLRVVRFEFNDTVYEGDARPRWIFYKISDEVLDPPADAARG
jgi:hypothetical protein